MEKDTVTLFLELKEKHSGMVALTDLIANRHRFNGSLIKLAKHKLNAFLDILTRNEPIKKRDRIIPNKEMNDITTHVQEVADGKRPFFFLSLSDDGSCLFDIVSGREYRLVG